MALQIKIKDTWLKRITNIASINQLYGSIHISSLQEALDLLFKMVEDQSFVNKKDLLEDKMVPTGSSI